MQIERSQNYLLGVNCAMLKLDPNITFNIHLFQSPASMKSVVQASWLLTVAFGNLIVVVVAETSLFSAQWMEFFLFAGLMGIDTIIFIILAYFYVYVDYSQGYEAFSNEEEKGPTP